VIKHVLVKEQAICEASFYVAEIDTATRSAFRDINCAACLRRAITASEQRTAALLDLLGQLERTP
jgi:hypothetical protein